MMTGIIRLYTKEDFIKYIQAPFNNNVVDDAAIIAVDSVAYNTTYQAFRLNDSSALRKGCLTIPVGPLKIGDLVEVELECMNVSGTKVKIAMDYFPSGINAGILQSEKSNEFETLGATFVSTRDSDASVIIGVFTADIGDFYLRGVKIKVNNGNNISKGSPIKATRQYNINGTAAGLSASSIFGVDKCVITINSTTKRITINHEIPFTSELRGAAIGQVSAFSRPGLILKTVSETRYKTDVMLYNLDTKEYIDPVTIQNDLDFWFNIVHHGFDI